MKFLFLLLEHNLEFDLHFDDDFYEVESINSKTDTIAILVELDLHPKKRMRDNE